MPLKLTVGVSRKIGLPRYGSSGASCALEVELDQTLLFHEVDALHEKVREAFDACRRAVSEELGREPEQFQESTLPPGNGDANSGNGQQSVQSSRHALPATERQIQAIEGMAARQ
jgi:hypothetical protein